MGPGDNYLHIGPTVVGRAVLWNVEKIVSCSFGLFCSWPCRKLRTGHGKSADEENEIVNQVICDHNLLDPFYD